MFRKFGKPRSYRITAPGDWRASASDPTGTARLHWGFPYMIDASGNTGGAGLVDFGFRTYVTLVPEPRTATLIYLGALLALAVRTQTFRTLAHPNAAPPDPHPI